jgi:transcriptional regulator with XRE-family HTH domain
MKHVTRRIDSIRLTRSQCRRLRKARERAELSQARLAAVLELGSAVNVSYVESGKRQVTVTELEAWAGVCGVAAVWIFGSELPDPAEIRNFTPPDERPVVEPRKKTYHLEHYAAPRLSRHHVTDTMLQLIASANDLTVSELEEMIATARLLKECRDGSGGNGRAD